MAYTSGLLYAQQGLTMNLLYVVGALGVLLSLALTGEAATLTPPQAAAPNVSHFSGFSDFSHFTILPGIAPDTLTLESPVFDAPLSWDELVVSWNAALPAATELRIEARGIYPDHSTRYYTLGLWSANPTGHPHSSVNHQGDADGDVNTDTLALKRSGANAQLRLTFSNAGATQNAQPTLAANWKQALKFVGLCFADTSAKSAPLEPNRAAWGQTIAVPERSQVSYPGGEVWCSPTSVSMDLAYWSHTLQRPELDKDVPEVARNVYDAAWGGTGNWPFNTAFAGSFPGMRAYVTRLSDVAELEDWIAAGIPVILSVSYDLLQGKATSQDAGHLVMCVGFTAQGDVVVNDPWARLEKGETVRKTFSRHNLIAGWGNSHNTVYLIYPETVKPPQDRFGHWAAKW